MVDIQGIGTLIRGASGIGKSECVLSLIERGYSLVSDDITRIRSIEGREFLGMSADITRFHMEVRGIGVINISSILVLEACEARNDSTSFSLLRIGTSSKMSIALDWIVSFTRSWAYESLMLLSPSKRAGILAG